MGAAACRMFDAVVQFIDALAKSAICFMLGSATRQMDLAYVPPHDPHSPCCYPALPAQTTSHQQPCKIACAVDRILILCRRR